MLYGHIKNPHCPSCHGTLFVRNKRHRERTWLRLERQAFTLITNCPNIDKYPRAHARLIKLRNIAARYQSTIACPTCWKRRKVTVDDVAKRLGIEKWHPHYDLLKDWVDRGMATWEWPERTDVIYLMEKILREDAERKKRGIDFRIILWQPYSFFDRYDPIRIIGA